jgi:hypothetical protein
LKGKSGDNGWKKEGTSDSLPQLHSGEEGFGIRERQIMSNVAEKPTKKETQDLLHLALGSLCHLFKRIQ